MSMLMGLTTNYAYAIAPGIGLNAVVAFGLVASGKTSYPEAMGLVVLEGVAMVVLAVTGLRELIFKAIPLELKKAIAIGIGLFIAFIGLYNSGIIANVDPGGGTPVKLGSFTTWPIFVTIFGLVFTFALRAIRFRGDLIVGIIGTTVVATIINALVEPSPGLRHHGGDVAGLASPLRRAELPPAREDQPAFVLEHAARRHRFARLGLLPLPERLLRLLGDGDRRREGRPATSTRTGTSRSSRRR